MLNAIKWRLKEIFLFKKIHPYIENERHTLFIRSRGGSFNETVIQNKRFHPLSKVMSNNSFHFISTNNKRYSKQEAIELYLRLYPLK